MSMRYGKNWIQIILGVMCFFATNYALAQPPPLEDKRTQELYVLGDKYFKAKNYDDAAKAFDEGAHRPFNKFTTSSVYMAGLAYFNLGQYERSVEYFQRIITSYRKSTFYQDALYHKGLAMLRIPAKREGGLYVLINLMEQSPSIPIKDEATKAVNKFLYYETDTTFLKKYFDSVRESVKSIVMEALCYQLYKAGKRKEVVKQLAIYEEKMGVLTQKLKKLAEEPAVLARPSELRIAILMPFFAAETDSIDPQALASLDLLAGIESAFENDSFATIRKINVLVADTESDTARIDKIWREQVLPFKPNVVIGEYKNRQSIKLATLAEASNIIQIVPFSPSEDIISGKRNIFLANPSPYTSAREAGRYARENMGHNRFMVIHDESRASIRMADGFTEGAANPASFVLRRRISSSKDIATLNLDDVSHHLKQTYYHAVFMPIANEEVVSYGMYSFRRDSIDTRTQVYGIDGWQRYSSLDDETLRSFRTIVSDPYYQGVEPVRYSHFQRNFLNKYHTPPTKFAVQGYDIARFVVAAYNRNITSNLPGDVLRKMPPFQGLNQSYFFNGKNDNQRVQLLEYLDGDVFRVKSW